MKKRILSMLLTVLMLVSLIPAMSISASADTHSHEGGWTPITTEAQLRDLFANGGSGYLNADITLSEGLSVQSEEPIYLCLNGYELDLGENQIYLHNGSKAFNLYDCSTAATGKITNGSADDGGAVNVEKNTEFNMYGGTITGCKANRGGAVYCLGSFHMYGGSITGNEAYAIEDVHIPLPSAATRSLTSK